MSHFVVLVIGPDIEGQLAPYNENLREVFVDLTEKYRKQYDEDSAFAVQDKQGLWQPTCENAGVISTRFNMMYRTFEVFCKCWYEEEPNEDGRYGYMHNPQAEWDWYQVGGRWTGYFKAKPGTQGQLGGVSDKIKLGCYDIMRKGDIDFEGMMIDRRAIANEQYDLYEKAVVGIEVPKRWAEFREDFDSIEHARTAYAAHPYSKALRDAKIDPQLGGAVEIYGVGRNVYVNRSCYGAFVPYAVLKDGEWVARGSMGWWGMSTETVDGDEWQKRIAEMLFALPDDTIITAVDCHI
jgi:hypothetical protein